ncbi:MAG TPA: hypothetical protein VFA23_07095, partial [Dongiaceae bacterium]|nr:hypothetical protein [Dongiaceae bacterium]
MKVSMLRLLGTTSLVLFLAEVMPSPVHAATSSTQNIDPKIAAACQAQAGSSQDAYNSCIASFVGSPESSGGFGGADSSGDNSRGSDHPGHKGNDHNGGSNGGSSNGGSNGGSSNGG